MKWTQPMWPTAQAIWFSPEVPLDAIGTAERVRHALEGGPICMIPRVIKQAIVADLDQVSAAGLPRFDLHGIPDGIRRSLDAAPARDDAREARVVAWLHDDVDKLTRLFTNVTGAARVRVHLSFETVAVGGTPSIQEGAVRLVTTYRGSGTEWLDSRTLALAAANQSLPGDATRIIPRGSLAFLSGGQNTSQVRPGAVHRAPWPEPEGRLLLTMDEA